MKINFIIKKLIVTIISIVLVFSLTSCNTKFVIKSGNDLNLDGYELVFCDEFEGDSLDTSVWEYRNLGRVKFHNDNLNNIEYKDYFRHPDQVSVENGCLVIEGEYTTSTYGEGWHSADIRLITRYTYGYFEIRCIPNNCKDFWSAFWLKIDDAYIHDISQGGIYGAEIDIFETYKNYDLNTKSYITSTIHCNGFDEIPDKVDSERVVKAYVKDLYTEYTTFGLLWTEDEYIFYVNGVETGRSSFAAGTSSVPEDVIISLCAPQSITLSKDITARFLVDYVKIYQIKR